MIFENINMHVQQLFKMNQVLDTSIKGAQSRPESTIMMSMRKPYNANCYQGREGGNKRENRHVDIRN